MSVSRWAYIPERCDGDACPGDCDLCSKTQDNVALMEENNDVMDDLIRRADAQTELVLAARRYTVAHEAHGYGRVVWSDNLISVSDAVDVLRKLPSAQPEPHYDEWCTDCKEYDHDKHCCPRFNRVIRTAVDEQKHGKWIDLRQEGDSRFMCSVCKWKEHVPTCMGKPTVWEYCPSCGARMDGEEEHNGE